MELTRRDGSSRQRLAIETYIDFRLIVWLSDPQVSCLASLSLVFGQDFQPLQAAVFNLFSNYTLTTKGQEKKTLRKQQTSIRTYHHIQFFHTVNATFS